MPQRGEEGRERKRGQEDISGEIEGAGKELLASEAKQSPKNTI